MKRLLLLSVLLACMCGPLRATTLTGSITNPTATGQTGVLTLRLSQQGAQLSTGGCGGPAVLVPTLSVSVAVANGALQGSPSVIGNDCISPSGTYYVAEFRDARNNVLFAQNWTLTGASVDIGTLAPTVVPQGTVSIGQAFVDTLTVSTLTGTTATITTLNGFATSTLGGRLDAQGNKTAQTGPVNNPYQYTIPANTVAVGKTIRVHFGMVKSGSTSTTYSLELNSQTVFSFATTTSGAQFWFVDIMRTGATTAVYVADKQIAPARSVGSVSGLNWAGSQMLETAFAVTCCADTVEPILWVVELIQ